MWPRRASRLSQSQIEAESAIAETLTSGADSLPAWNALWDLVQSSDAQGKQDVLNALKTYVDGAVASDTTSQAQAFRNAIEDAMTATPVKRQVLPSREVREQYRDDQIEVNRKAMRDIGVRPGEGLPMWVMYMTRRNKRSWR